ncbi:hypothetical protein SAMN04489762_3388 [Terribacillus saccharophilus]|uniref:ABC-2 family transporter protein n=1 Tax=Terribacillus saccharophilus TaxID=361277 RepID=A0AAX2EJM3_9BACI|nr:hypothetical protein SAMN04489762_3388 [Terribacillus saccharophilus]
MARLFRLSLIDFRYILKNKALLVTLSFTIIYTCLFYFYLTNSTNQINVNANTYYQTFNDISFYIFLIIPALSLSKEYTFKTSRIIYTGILSKNQVLTYKVSSTLLFLLALGILHRLIGNIFWGFDQESFSFDILSNSLVETATIYFFAGIFTISLTFLSSLVSYSRLSTVIFTVAIFILERFVRGILLLLVDNDLLKLLLNHNPLGIIQNILQYGNLTIMDGIILTLLSAVLFLISIILINKKAID